jgi:hypothetical protein
MVRNTCAPCAANVFGHVRSGRSIALWGMNSLRPCCRHLRAWMRAPRVSEASTTTVPSERPLITALRMGKKYRLNPLPWVELRYECSRLGDELLESGVFLRIHAIHRGPEHRHGLATPLEGAKMCRFVNAPREARYDDDAALAQEVAQLPRPPRTVLRRLPGADHGDGRPVQQVEVADHEKERRCIGNLPQPRWILSRSAFDHRSPGSQLAHLVQDGRVSLLDHVNPRTRGAGHQREKVRQRQIQCTLNLPPELSGLDFSRSGTAWQR